MSTGSPPTTGTTPIRSILGVYLETGERIRPGDEVRLDFTGRVRGIASDWGGASPWTPEPFRPHVRYRTATDAPWVVLEDGAVQPLTILPDPAPAFVKAVAPLDVSRWESFTVAVIVTDKYGNPGPVTGEVTLTGDYSGPNPLVFDDEWRREVTHSYSRTGDFRIIPVADFPTAGGPEPRPVYNHTHVTGGDPPFERLMGDLQMHTGDGGTHVGPGGLAERKFMEYASPGDHLGLFSRTRDALAYLQYVSGYDYGAVSEHSVRWWASRSGSTTFGSSSRWTSSRTGIRTRRSSRARSG